MYHSTPVLAMFESMILFYKINMVCSDSFICGKNGKKNCKKPFPGVLYRME